jgi:hypothetical protein
MKDNRTDKQETRVLSAILRFIEERGCRDYDNFASSLTDAFIQSRGKHENSFFREAKRLHTNFFQGNRITKIDFLHDLDQRLLRLRPTIVQRFPENPRLSLEDIFPETKSLRLKIGAQEYKALDMEEQVVQEALRNALAEKGASPIPGERKDSGIEVADLEHFYMKVHGREYSFSAVVKGYRSVGKKTTKISFKQISHQVLKANRTKPDYIILAVAKEFKNDVISEISTYSADVGKPHLVVYFLPRDLVRFLHWREVIRP